MTNFNPQEVEAHSAVNFLNDSERVSLHNDTIAVTVGNNNRNVFVNKAKSALNPIELLLHQCALDGLVDANARFDPPRCSPETRQIILQDIQAWIYSDSPHPAILWLTGSAGSGKSAICQTVAETSKADGALLANFFFSRVAGSSGRSNGDRLLPTLVYQLQNVLPETKAYIEEAIRVDRSILTSTRHSQMETLFRFPVSQVADKTLKARLVVIDGLDECQDTAIQADILRVLADSTASLPVPLRIIIASRPEAHIRHTFDHHPTLTGPNIHWMDLDDDHEAHDDLWRFVSAATTRIRQTHPLRQYLDPSWPSYEDLDVVVSKSSPQFIFASTVMNYIDSPDGRPDHRLKDILDMANSPDEEYEEAPLENIDKLYRFIFSQVKAKYRTKVWATLSIIHLVIHRSFTTPEPTVEFFEELFGAPQGMVTVMLTPLLSVLSIPNTEQKREPIKSLHASLFDFLLDSRRSGDLVLDLGIGHSYLLVYYGQQDLKQKSLLFLRGILLHGVALPADATLQPAIDHIVTEVLRRECEVSGAVNLQNGKYLSVQEPIMPRAVYVDVVELVFDVLAKYDTSINRSSSLQPEDEWLSEALGSYEELPELWVSHNPFTSSFLRVKHCAYMKCLRDFPTFSAETAMKAEPYRHQETTSQSGIELRSSSDYTLRVLRSSSNHHRRVSHNKPDHTEPPPTRFYDNSKPVLHTLAALLVIFRPEDVAFREMYVLLKLTALVDPALDMNDELPVVCHDLVRSLCEAIDDLADTDCETLHDVRRLQAMWRIEESSQHASVKLASKLQSQSRMTIWFGVLVLGYILSRVVDRILQIIQDR